MLPVMFIVSSTNVKDKEIRDITRQRRRDLSGIRKFEFGVRKIKTCLRDEGANDGSVVTKGREGQRRPVEFCDERRLGELFIDRLN